MTKTRFYNLLWILLTGLGTGLWISCVWPVIDDLAYLHRVVEPDYWALSGGLIENQAQLAESIVNHYTMVNSRLANLMALAVLTLPRGVQAAVCGVAAAALVAALIALGDPHGRITAPVATALVWIALPWHDGLASVDFEINYVWTSAMALWVMVAAVKCCCARSATFVAATAGAFLAGWMHEGIAVMAGAFLACLWWQAPGRRRVPGLLLAALIAGFAVNLAGATLTRALTALGSNAGPGTIQWLRSATAQLWPLWLAAAGAVALRKRVDMKALAPAAAAAVASLAMCGLLHALGRAAWGANLAALILLLKLLQYVPSCPGLLRKAAVALAPAIYVLWLAQLLAWQSRISHEEREMAALASATTDTLRVDLTPECDIPFTLKGIVQHPPLMMADYNSVYARHYCGRDGIPVLPAGTSGKLPGHNPFYTAGWPMLVTPCTTLPDTIAVELTYGPLRASASPLDRLAALAMGTSDRYTTRAIAVRGHAPGIYFIEGAGRFSRGRALKCVKNL